MKIYTDPDTGISCGLLSTTERKLLARAKSVLVSYATVNRAHDAAKKADAGGDAIQGVLVADKTPHGAPAAGVKHKDQKKDPLT